MKNILARKNNSEKQSGSGKRDCGKNLDKNGRREQRGSQKNLEQGNGEGKYN